MVQAPDLSASPGRLASDPVLRRLAGAIVLSLAAHFALFSSFGPVPQRQKPRVIPIDLRLEPEVSRSGASILAADKPSPVRTPIPTAKRQRADPAPPAAPKRLLDPPEELVRNSIDGFDLQIGAATTEQEMWRLLHLPLAPESEYLTAEKVDKRAEMIGDLALEYPDAAAIRGTQILVVLRVLIEESGEVGGVQVVSTSAEQSYGELARQAFLSARFKPAEKDGRPVKSQKTVEVSFSPG